MTASNTQVQNPSEPLFAVADALLSQVVDLLRDVVTTDEQLSFESVLIPGSTIGKHLRHVHDHIRLLLDSLDHPASASSPDSTLDLSYDIRSRNVASETSHTAAVEAFVGLRKRLEVETDRGRKIASGRRVRLEAVTPVVVEVESTWARELWFCSLHSTHHFALLRVIAVGELSLSMPPDFGVAPSTLASRTWESNSTPIADERESSPKL